MPRVVGDETWLTVGEFAELLGVSDTTARTYIDEQRLPARRLPSGHRRVKVSDARAFYREIYGEDPPAA